jgi:membrane protein implicated in regulation of membrane protease activity
MDKRKKFFLIDTALIALLAASSISGLLLWSVIPRGTGGLRWFLKDLHKWSGTGMAGFAFYHLMLHWDWYKKTGRRLIVNNNHPEDTNKKV